MKSRREIVHVILCLHLCDFWFTIWWFLFKWMEWKTSTHNQGKRTRNWKEMLILKSGTKVAESEHVRGEMSRKREKKCTPETRNGSSARCCCFAQFFPPVLTALHSLLKFRNHKNYFIYEIMMWHINVASKLQETMGKQNGAQLTSTNDAGKMVINLSTIKHIMRTNALPWYKFWHL